MMVENQSLLLSEHNSNNDNKSTAECRNCHEYGGDDLIAPCMCSGSIKYVHRRCLNDWRVFSPNPTSFSNCDVCGFQYELKERDDLKSSRTKKFALVFSRDFIGAMLVIQVIVAILGSICFAFDHTNLTLTTLFPSTWNTVGVYYIWGLFVFSCLAAMYGACWALFVCGGGHKNSGYSVSYNTYPYYWGPYYYWWWYPNGYSCFPCYLGSCRGGGCGGCAGCGSRINCGSGGSSDKSGGIAILGLIILAVAIIVGFIVMVVIATIIFRRHSHILHKRQDARELEVVDMVDRNWGQMV